MRSTSMRTGWYELFLQGLYMEEIVQAQWGLLGEFDPARNIKLVVDEYGAWYKPGTQLDPTHLLGQQVTLRDALLTAMTLDIFNRHAEKVGMAASAQLVNCLNALFFSHEDKFITTPVFHVFDCTPRTRAGSRCAPTSLRRRCTISVNGKPTTLAGLLGSASLNGKTVTFTATNPDLKQPRVTEIVLRGSARIVSAEASVLTDADMHAHNTFEQPNAVQLKKQPVEVQGDRLTVTLPPASVSSITHRDLLRRRRDRLADSPVVRTVLTQLIFDSDGALAIGCHGVENVFSSELAFSFHSSTLNGWAVRLCFFSSAH